MGWLFQTLIQLAKIVDTLIAIAMWAAGVKAAWV